MRRSQAVCVGSWTPSSQHGLGPQTRLASQCPHPQPQSQTPAGAANLLVSAGDGGEGVVVRLASCRKGKWTPFHFCFEARHILCVPPPRRAPVLAPTTSCGQCGDEALESLGMWPSLPCGEPRPQALTSLLPGHGCPTMEATFSGLLVAMPPPLSL